MDLCLSVTEDRDTRIVDGCDQCQDWIVEMYSHAMTADIPNQDDQPEWPRDRTEEDVLDIFELQVREELIAAALGEDEETDAEMPPGQLWRRS
jgi:hypothetical protein